MQEFSVMFHSVHDVEEFVGLVTIQPFPVRLSDGIHQISGRGFIEMFCLELSRPVHVCADCPSDVFERFRQSAERFLV